MGHKTINAIASLVARYRLKIKKLHISAKYKKAFGILLFSVLNGALCLWILIASQSIYFLSESDAKVLHQINSLTDLVFDSKKDTLPVNVLLVNTCYDNSLVEYLVDSVPMGNIPVTDRNKLAAFLSKLKISKTHNYVICDVLFENPSPYDSILLDALKQPNLVTAVRGNGSKFIFHGQGVNTGFVDITTSSNTFYKYSMFSADSKGKSIPLVAFEDCYGKKVFKGTYWNYHNGKRLLNNFIPELTYTNYDISDIPLINLGEIIELPPSFFNATVKDKFIVIGDFFEHDKILTSIGKVQGPLILVNTYIALVNGRNVITNSLLVVLFFVFTVLSYLLLRPMIYISGFLSNKPINIASLIIESIIAFSIISYAIFWVFGIKMVFAWTALFFNIEYLTINFKSTITEVKNKVRRLIFWKRSHLPNKH